MCWPHPAQVGLLQVEQVIRAHIVGILSNNVLDVAGGGSVRGLRVAFGELSAHVFHVEVAGALDQPIELRFAKRARLRVDHAPVTEHHQCRNRCDVKLAGELLLGLSVDLAEDDVWMLHRRLLEHGRKCPARPAPCCPEIHKHDPVADCLGEVSVRQVFCRHDSFPL